MKGGTITSLRALSSTAKVDNDTSIRFNNTYDNVILINPITELHEWILRGLIRNENWQSRI